MTTNDHPFVAEVLPLFEATRRDWLLAARSVAYALAQDGRTVTVDDVRKRCPPPPGVDPRVMGGVFAGKAWVKLGMASSGRRLCHNRPIGLFRLKAA